MKNNFHLIRFTAASLVLYGHCYPLTGRGTYDYLTIISQGIFPTAHIGVCFFFIVSGFLVSESFVRSTPYSQINTKYSINYFIILDRSRVLFYYKMIIRTFTQILQINMRNIVITSCRSFKKLFLHQQNNRVFGLDLIRTIAILLVLFSHGFDPFLSEYFPNLRQLIFMDGVDLFFVLSGFLIGSILLKKFDTSLDYSPRIIFSFWKRRWMRTLPLYFFILFIILFMPVIVPTLKGNYSLIPFKVWGSFLIFSQNLFTPQIDFFSEAWSLSVEEWFYITTPLLLFLTNFIFKNIFSKKIIFLIMIMLVLLGSIIYRYEIGLALTGKISDWDLNIRRVVFARLDSIMFGVLGAFIKLSFPSHWKKEPLFPYFNLLGVLLLFITHFLYLEAIDNNTNFFMNTFYFSLTGIAVMLFLPQFSHWKKPPAIGILGIIGKVVTHISIISYSLYLTHGYLVLGHLKRYKYQYFDKLLPHSQFIGIFYFTIYVTVSIIISTFLYYSIEKTFMDMRNKQI